MSSFIYHKQIFILSLFIVLIGNLNAQDLQIESNQPDTTQTNMNMDAVYDRPTLTVKNAPISIGGYFEANSIYAIQDGISEGLSFQARRLTIFLSASISKRIKFFTEIEFEEGGEEVAIEFAAVDIALHPLLNFRGGIILNPIGGFNQNHDGPKWEFVERPNIAVDLLPATFSNAGFGLFGKTYTGNWVFGYEAYLTNGFSPSIIDNERNRTSLPAVKNDPDRFEENFSGNPLITTKVAISNKNIGEIGISYMGGSYNRQMEDGLQIAKKTRRVDVLALDFNTTIKKTGTGITGETAYIWVDVPDSYTQQFGDRQWGYFVDIVQPVLKRKLFAWENATLNLAARLDYVDFNVGTFKQTGGNIADHLFAVTPAISFRPTQQTVLRLNYRYETKQDILGNPSVKTATWYFGISTYF